MRIRPALYAWLPAVIFVCGSLLLAAEMAKTSPKSSDAAPAPAANPGRQREGSTLVDVVGSFKLNGDRATFYPAGSEQRYQGLENLNLERISLVVGENPDQLDWIVSGTITEYRGSNFLLVTKAILKSKAHAAAR